MYTAPRIVPFEDLLLFLTSALVVISSLIASYSNPSHLRWEGPGYEAMSLTNNTSIDHAGAVQDSKASNRPQKTSHLMIKRLRALSSTCV